MKTFLFISILLVARQVYPLPQGSIQSENEKACSTLQNYKCVKSSLCNMAKCDLEKTIEKEIFDPRSGSQICDRQKGFCGDFSSIRSSQQEKEVCCHTSDILAETVSDTFPFVYKQHFQMV